METTQDPAKHDGPTPKKVFKSADTKSYVLDDWARDFVDPTQRLSPRVGGTLLEFPDEVLDRWAARLRSLPLHIFCCADAVVRYATVHALRPLLPAREARQIMFGNFAVRAHQLTRRMFGHDAFGGGGESLVYVYADRPEADGFLEEMPNDPHYYDRWAETLLARHVVVVVTTPDRLKLTKAARLNQPVYVEAVDFIAPRLRSAFPESWRTIAADVKRQHERGLWGASDEHLVDWLSTLTAGNEAFERQYDACRRAMEEDDSKAALSRFTRDKGERVSVVLTDNTPIQAAVLFTAAYFRQLPVAEFLETVVALLGERPALEQPAPPAPPAGQEARPVPPVLLKEQWQRGTRGFLKTCDIHTVGTQPPALDFEAPDVREAMRTRFESVDVIDYQELCERVDASGLIGHASAGIHEGAIALTAKRIIADKQGFGASCLPRLIRPLLPLPLRDTSAGDRASDGGDPIAADPFAFAHAPNADVERIVIALVSLFTRLLDEGATDTVAHLVRTMMEHHRHAELLRLLARMAHPSFTTERFAIYRRLIDEGDNDLRRIVCEMFLRTLSSGDGRAATVLKALRGWADGGAAPHHKLATQLLRDVLTGTIVSDDWSRAHPIASMLTSVPDDEARALLEWMADQSTDDLLEEFQGIPYGEILCVTYLWILPRPVPPRAFDPTSSIWPIVQLSWLTAFQHGVQLQLNGIVTEPFDETFAALALADYAMALSRKELEADDATRTARQAQIPACVLALPRQRNRAVRAQWRAMEQALGECLIQWPETSAAQDKELFHAVRNRWREMRAAIKGLLAASAPSNTKDDDRDRR
jgi:hypothetical protein